MASTAVALREPAVRVIPAPQLPPVRQSLVDRAIGLFSPATALKRYEARVRLAAASTFFGTGGYEGARSDRPATKNWNPALGSADAATIPDLPALRARSGDLDRNDPIASGVLETKSTHIVGAGIVGRSRIDREFLGLTDEQADAWERDCDRIANAHLGTTAIDITGTTDFYGLEDLTLLGTLSRGDILAVRRFKERAGDLLSVRVQLVEADRVCNPTGRLNSDTLVDGVEKDADGRAIKFYVLDRHPDEFGYAYGLAGGAGGYVEVEAYGTAGDRRALLVFRQRRPGQTRGVPLLAPVIERLKQISRYGEAELMAAVIQSFFTVFLKTNTGEDGLPDMGDPNTAAAATATPALANDVRLGHGAIVGLAPGEDPVMANPARPNSAFDPFMLAWFRQIGIATNTPYEILIKHFSSSYSASRGAMLEFYRGVTRDRSWLVRGFCQPVREWVIEEAIARGLLRAPGFFQNPLVRQAYCKTEWTGPTMGQLDPKAEAEAAVLRMNNHLTTLADETAQMTGADYEQVLRQRAREDRVREDLGLPRPITAGAPAPAAPERPAGSGPTPPGRDTPPGPDARVGASTARAAA